MALITTLSALASMILARRGFRMSDHSWVRKGFESHYGSIQNSCFVIRAAKRIPIELMVRSRTHLT